VALFIDKLDPPFPVLIDEWASLKDRYRIHDVPLAVILDREQVVQAAVITTSAEKIEVMIEQALGAELFERDPVRDEAGGIPSSASAGIRRRQP
jgi:hypothetical protein